jgi:polar amino acid transport system ATP-binding protein
MTQPFVAMRNVYKAFGKFQALQNLSLDVQAGQVLCLIGASGSGKTTLLRCVNQLVRIDSGAIWLDGGLLGARVQNARMHLLTEAEIASQRQKTGMVFQRFNLFPHMTALQNISEGPVQVQGRKPGEVRGEALELLARVGLADKSANYPSELSGGQQQRVAIARALAMRTHELGFAREVADRVVYMDAGRIVEEGPPSQVLGAPTEARTKAFLSAVIA